MHKQKALHCCPEIFPDYHFLVLLDTIFVVNLKSDILPSSGLASLFLTNVF